MAKASTASTLVISENWFPQPEIVATYYDNLGIVVRSFREPLDRAVRRVLIPSIKENFASGGRPDSWAPLNEFTQKKRKAKGYGEAGPILKRTGLLEKVASQLNIWTIDRDSATAKPLATVFGGKAAYGDVHQEGGPSGTSGWIPARPFLVIQDWDKYEIEFIFTEWLEEMTLRSGFSLEPGYF